MHSRIILNNRLVNAARARLPALAASAFYGRGVFTTLAVYHGHPFLWPQQWARLLEHAARTGIGLKNLNEELIGGALARLIEANRVQAGRARVMLLARGLPVPWQTKKDERATDFLILTGDTHPDKEDGLALTLSPYRVNTLSPLTAVKSINYLEHILACEEARARDFDEAVVLNERGEVVSATMANIFWVTGDGVLHTPALATGALAGTTRALVLSLAGEMGVPHVESVYDFSQLGEASEIFLTSAGLGVAFVTTFDFRRYTIHVGSIALRLHEAFRQLTLRAD